MKRLIALYLIASIAALYANGNILVWLKPLAICLGWPDDAVFSWWCVP